MLPYWCCLVCDEVDGLIYRGGVEELGVVEDSDRKTSNEGLETLPTGIVRDETLPGSRKTDSGDEGQNFVPGFIAQKHQRVPHLELHHPHLPQVEGLPDLDVLQK